MTTMHVATLYVALSPALILSLPVLLTENLATPWPGKL